MAMRLKATVTGTKETTKHFLGTIVDDTPVPKARLPVPAWVEISEEEDAFYLLYFDADGSCFADTWHQTVGAAKRQAHFEFGIRDDAWTEV